MAITQNVKGLIGGYRSRVYLSDGGGGNVQLSMASELSENDQNSVTAYAIENGSPVTDHIISSPKSWSLSGIITDDVTDVLEYPYNILKFGDLKEMLNVLERWVSDKTLLTYYSYDDDFDNVVIESLSRQTSLETGYGLGVAMTLKKVKVVNSMTAQVKLNPMNMKGVTSKASSAAKTADKSILSSLTGIGK